MTTRFKLCLKAAATLNDADAAALADSIQAYRTHGMDDRASERAAVADLLAQVEQERKDMTALLRAQHPGLFIAANEAQKTDSAAETVDQTTAPEQTAKIEDAGEKIGGARKDTADRGFTRSTRKESDDRPAWAKRFKISQIVKAAGQINSPREEGRWVINDSRSTDYLGQPKQVGRDTFATKEEAEAFVPIAAVSMKHRPVPMRNGKYEIWRDVSDRKRVKVVDKEFDTRDEAMAYMATNAVQIIETNTTFGEADIPLPPDRARTGPERRNGDVSGGDFLREFGLRGVEFGNWNDQAERQALMNDAWDGLMDLADLLGIPPHAIGLGGDLALAFGARGNGLASARAHYELDRSVINLTKERGAGSLAHEWFHALDHYFGRQDGKAPAEWTTLADGTRTLKAIGDGADMASSGFSRGSSGVRDELRQAYNAIITTMAKKAETYVEDTARVDKFTGTAREELAQALQSLRRDLAEQKDVRYYKRNNKPASAELLAEFDALSNAMLDGDMAAISTDWRTIKLNDTKAVTRWTNDALERMSSIYKEVRGRGGFDSTNRAGVMDRLRGNMERYNQRLKMLADAQSGAEKTRMVPTDFAMNARELDQGRGTDYWTTPHEMAARAFQGYVEDKIAERGGKSRFLNYGPENAGILTPWGFKRPFPAGAERAAINKAFDAFTAELKTRQDDNGKTVLFSRQTQEKPESPFYSAMSRAIERSPMNAGTAGAWKQAMKGMVSSGKVKADEVQWSGVDEWLDLQPGKVSKAQIGEYLAANGVRVTETVLGGDAQKFQQASDRLRAAGFDIESDDYFGVTLQRDGNEVSRDELTPQQRTDLETLGAGNGADAPLETGSTKYNQYTLPGGTNYREVLLTMPVKMTLPDGFEARQIANGRWGVFGPGQMSENRYGSGPTREAAVASFSGHGHNGAVYKSGHWEQPNILAHIRVNDRTDAEGKRVLFVEEIQSDWGQEGKKKGFAESGKGWEAKKDEAGRWDVYNDGEYQATVDAGSETAAISMLLGQRTGVPRAPFVTKTDAWLGLALKRIVTMAVEGGYDKVAFVTGEQSAERYDLSRQVDRITVYGRTDATTGEKSRSVNIDLANYGGAITLGVNNQGVVDNQRAGAGDLVGKPLSDVIGKEMADRVMGADLGVGGKEFSGDGLKVGGEGMKTFYDQIVPNAAKALLKKLGGGTLGPVELPSNPKNPSDKPRSLADYASYEDFKKGKIPGLTQPGFEITPAMREAATGGLPLFKRGEGSGLHVEAIRQMLDGLASAGLRSINVLASPAGLPLAKRSAILAKAPDGAVRGAYFRSTDEIFLFADNLKSLPEAVFVALHEGFHRGLHITLGDEGAKVLRQIYATNKRVRDLADANMAEFKDMGKEEAINEAMADLAGAGEAESLRGWAKLARLVRDWIAKIADALGMELHYTDAMVSDLIAKMTKAGLKGGVSVNVAPAQELAMANRDQVKTPAFKAWFGASKITDEQGQPKVMYHGTGQDITGFRPKQAGAIFVTSEPIFAQAYADGSTMWMADRGQDGAANIMPVYVKAEDPFDYENPAHRGDLADKLMLDGTFKLPRTEYSRADLYEALADKQDNWALIEAPEAQDAIRALGFDGFYVSEGGFKNLAVYDPKQIKSAVGNQGTFDGTSDDLRLSRGQAEEAPLLSRHTPDERAALARAGIAPRRRLGDHIRRAWDAARGVVSDRTELAQAMRQGTLDQFYGIQRAVQRDIGNLPIEQDPYITARLANGGTSSVMRALLLHGQAQWALNGQHLEKKPGTDGLLDILKPLGDDLNDWFGWMIGNRAARLKTEGRENNFSDPDIRALQGLANTPQKLAEFRAAAVKYAAFKRSVLDVGQAAGIINPDTRAAWDNADYIPFYRQIDEKASFSPTGRKGLAGQSSGIRTLRGGDAALSDPIENLLMNFSRIIDASLKNNAISKTVDTLIDAGSFAVEKIGYDMKSAIIPMAQIKKQLLDAGTPQQIIDVLPPEAFDGMAKMWSIQAPSDKDVIRVMRDGKPEFYRVHDPLLLKAATSFVPFDFPGLGVMRAFKRVLTATVTATPEFMLRNFIRDSAAVHGIARTGVNPAKSVAGIVKAFRENGAAEHMLFSGASFQSGNINAADPTGTATAVRRALRQKGMDATSTDRFIATIVDKPARLWEIYRNIGEAVENANREAMFEATTKAGGSVTAAAFEAKDLMDFSLRGSSPLYQLAADVLPFFNARVQGMYRLGRSDPKRVAIYAGIMATLSVALVMANSGQDWYDELPDWDKDTYWHFRIGGQHYRIPKPFELGVAFATIPERIARYLAGQDTAGKMGSRLWANVRDQLAFDPIPQALRPAANVWANKDTFRDSPIETHGDEQKLPHLRAGARTSPAAQSLLRASAPATDAIGLSPKKLEYLVGGYFGTAGLYALGLADMAVRKLEGYPPQPTLRVDDLPVVRAFVRADPARATVFESDLYKIRERADEVYKSVKALEKDDKPDQAKKLADANQKYMDAAKTLDKSAKDLAKIRKDQNTIYADKTMTPDQKRAELDKLQVLKNKTAKETMRDPVVKALQ